MVPSSWSLHLERRGWGSSHGFRDDFAGAQSSIERPQNRRGGRIPARRALVLRRLLDSLEAQREVEAALALLLECADRVGRLVTHDVAGPRGDDFLRRIASGRLRRWGGVEDAAKHVGRELVRVDAWRSEGERELLLAMPAADLVRDAVDGAVAVKVRLAGLLLLRVLEEVSAIPGALLLRHVEQT